MADQAVIVYISTEGGEINDLTELVNGSETELNWVGTLNGQNVPIKVRLSETDPEDEWPDEVAHDYENIPHANVLRDHLIGRHGYVPESANFLYEQGFDQLVFMHNQLHNPEVRVVDDKFNWMNP